MPPKKKRASVGMPTKRKSPAARTKALKQKDSLENLASREISVGDPMEPSNNIGKPARQGKPKAPTRQKGQPQKAVTTLDKENANIPARNVPKQQGKKKAPRVGAVSNGSEILGTGDQNANFVESPDKAAPGEKRTPATSPTQREPVKRRQPKNAKAMIPAQQTIDDVSDISIADKETVPAKKKKISAAKNKELLNKEKTVRGTVKPRAVKKNRKASQADQTERATGSPNAKTTKRAGKKAAVKRPRDQSTPGFSDEEEPAVPARKRTTAAKSRRIVSPVPEENADENPENSASSPDRGESEESSRSSLAQTTGEFSSTVNRTGDRSSKTMLQNRSAASSSSRRTSELSETEKMVKDLQEEKAMLNYKIFQAKQQIQAMRLRKEVEERDRIIGLSQKSLDSEEDLKEAADIVRRMRRVESYTGLKLLRAIREKDPSDPLLRHCYLRGYVFDVEFIITFKNPINIADRRGTSENVEIYFPSGCPPGLEEILEPWKEQGNLEQCVVMMREYQKKIKDRQEILEDLNYGYSDILRARADPLTGQMTISISRGADAFFEMDWLFSRKPSRVPGHLNFFFRFRLTEQARRLLSDQQLDPSIIVKEMQKDPKKVLRTLAELVKELA